MKRWFTLAQTLGLASILSIAAAVQAAPKVVVISLDGATAPVVNSYFQSGVLNPNVGLGLLRQKGTTARRNITVVPSLTAPSHIAIATGSTPAANDINANGFHLVNSNFFTTISGFGAPIGGYQIGNPPAPSPTPTAEPLWVQLREAGKVVATATWPGGDGVDVKEPTSGVVVQSAVPTRTVDYTVPFGAFGGVGAKGYDLTNGFGPAPQTTLDQLAAAGKSSFSPIQQTLVPLDTFAVSGISYTFQIAALDTTNDSTTNYDTLVFFDTTNGIKPGPFALPATGPAYVQLNQSGYFYLEGSPNKAGMAFYVTLLNANLSQVRVAHSSANQIPRNPTVLANVDDINNNVGFWAPQSDFRIPERISPGFTTFPDSELELIYEDQVRKFVDYQTKVGLRAINQFPNADLVMIYIEQPDGSGHQFTLTDPRQATNFTDPNSIGAGQDAAKIARYQGYLQTAYQTANNAVQQVINAVGTDSNGVPNSNIIVVSDHGMAPFHTAVNMSQLLLNAGLANTQVRASTSGPAANIYISLQGREPNGTVDVATYNTLQQQVVTALKGYVDTNSTYGGATGTPLFSAVIARPLPEGFGTNKAIGQDAGDILAILTPGYNFDGTQSPVVIRQGDPVATTPVLSVPNFYGAHGYISTLPLMSAIFYAAGPNIIPGPALDVVRNIDIAPTVLKLLQVAPAPTVQGKVLPILKK